MNRILTIAVSVGLCLPVMAEDMPQPPAKPVDATNPAEGATPPVSKEAKAEKLLDEVSASLEVKAQAALAQADGFYLKAKSEFQAARFVEAREACEKALAAFPAHKKAQELHQDILGVLSVRNDRLQMVGTWLAAVSDVAVQEQAVQISRWLKDGDAAMAGGDYDKAFLAYDRVAIGLATFPYKFDWGELPSVVESKKLASKARARESAIRRDAEVLARSQEEAERRRNLEEDVLRLKVDEILRRAMAAYERKHYKRAEIDAWNAYQMDRRREDARALYLESRQRAHVMFDENHREARLEGLARVNEEIHRSLIPQADLLTFPEDWAIRGLRKPEELGTEKAEPWLANIANSLEQTVTFNWEDQGIEDVINFLRRTTGVNFVIDRAVYTEPPPPITLTATNMKLKTALGWITKMTSLHMAIRNEAVFISKDKAKGEVFFKVYAIGDLISPVQDFTGPNLAFSSGGAAGGGGGGFDLFGGAAGGGESKAAFDSDKIKEFIQKSVAPDSWATPGVAMELRQGSTLFVSQTTDVHEQIQALLSRLRTQVSLQVSVKIRVLDVRKSFMEEIGIAWNDLQSDLLLSRSNWGAFDFKREWGYGTQSVNEIPDNAMTTGFSNTRGQGMRFEWMYNNNGVLNRPTVNGILEALEQESDSQVVNAPELTCFNGQRANALFVRQFAYISDYAVAGENNYDPEIAVLNYGDIIDIRPLVSADRKYITLEVRPTSVSLQDVFVERITTVRQVNEVVFNSVYPMELPNVEVRALRSTVMLPDKGSLLLGGYAKGLRQRTHSGIPVLSHIPFLGRLFSKNGIYDETRHLFFLVTAEIVDLAEREALH